METLVETGGVQNEKSTSMKRRRQNKVKTSSRQECTVNINVSLLASIGVNWARGRPVISADGSSSWMEADEKAWREEDLKQHRIAENYCFGICGATCSAGGSQGWCLMRMQTCNSSSNSLRNILQSSSSRYRVIPGKFTVVVLVQTDETMSCNISCARLQATTWP